ncbi:hypothetical protein EV356DRAFT_452353 [Viridothelium virens]|uniref:Aminoglycoside phosphotransferase domain-containing protein n=1 Tax=Viridothelium virens TaxID=1048519 RepID=A0A6A6H048_VIRVR|nr:hypothetical protein EV356DRAFT_452353 [Viridothelium virens]
MTGTLSNTFHKYYNASQGANVGGSTDIQECNRKAHERQQFEIRALEGISENLKISTLGLNIRPPTIHRTGIDTHALVVSCHGEPALNKNTVEKMYQNTPSRRIRDIGIRLGRWLNYLHRSTRYLDIGPDGNTDAREVVCSQYARVTTALACFSLDNSIGDRVAEAYKGFLRTDNECVCMGNFSPRRVVIADLTPPLMVVDWKNVRRGSGATDAGRFAAEAWTIDRFKVGSKRHRGLANAFLKAYLHAAEPNFEFRMKLAVHIGVQLCLWSHVELLECPSTWVEMRGVAELGEAIIRKALDGNSSWIDLFLKA